jgi:hypothetical protein
MQRGLWDFWATTVAQNENRKMKLINAKTVKRLEGLAPGISAADNTTVSDLVLSGAVFEDFSQIERDAINSRLLGYKGRIPSFGLFFQDVLFLELGANRMKKLVDKSKWWGPYDTEMGDDPERKPTLRERMEHMFQHRDTDSIMIQTPDGEEREVSGDEELQFDLAYRQLWLCAFRSCSGIPGEGPRPATVCRSWTHPHEQYKLAQLASALGFKSNSISRLTSRTFEPEYPPWYEFDDRGKNPKLKRCGIPYTVTFREDRKTLYLNQIHQATPECNELDSAFILRDIYLSFFGDLPSSMERPQGPRRGGDGHFPGAEPYPTSGAENQPSTGATPSSTTMPSSTTTPRPTVHRETGQPATPAAPAADTNPQANSGREQSTPSPSMHRADVEEPESRPTMPSEPTEATTVEPTEPPVTPGETRDWRTELEALTDRLRKLRDDIDELETRFDNPKFADQQNAIIELHKLDDAVAEPTDAEARRMLGTIDAEISKRSMDIQSAKLRIHLVKGMVGSEISKLTAFTQNGEGRSQGTQAAQALSSAQVVFNSSDKEYQEVDEILGGVTARIQLLQRQIGSGKVYLLGKCLIDLHHKFENSSSDIDTVKQSVANLNTELGPSDMPASHESDVKILNDLRDDAITRVDLIWQKLEVVRGRFQEAGGQTRSLSPQECETLQQNSATELYMLKAEAEEALTTSQKQIQDVKGRLQTEYAQFILHKKGQIQSELESENTALEKLKSDYESIRSSVEEIRNTLRDDEESLKQSIGFDTLQRLRNLIPNGNLDSITQSLPNLQEAHRTSVDRLRNSTLSVDDPLDKQTKICSEYMDIRRDIDHREKERGILLERIERQRNSTEEYERQMAETLRSKVSSLLENVQLKASETTRQLQAVRESKSLAAAKQAMESAKQAADESIRLAKQLKVLAGLVHKAPLDIREHTQKGASDAMTAAQDAYSAAKTGQPFVNAWEEADQKMDNFLQSANKLKDRLITERDPVMTQWMPTQHHGAAKNALNRASNLALKTCNLHKRMKSEILSILDRVCESDQRQLAERVNLRVPEFEKAALETLNAALGLFYFVTQRTGDHTKSKLTEIENFSTSAIEAIEKNDRDRWLVIVRNAREAKNSLDKAVELAKKGMDEADRLKKATVDQEGSEGAIPGLALQHVEETRECQQFGKDNQTEARQVLQDIEISWSRALACKKKETAQEVYDRACDAVGKIQQDHPFNDAEIARTAFKAAKELFEAAMQDFQECRGPGEEFEKIADTFTDATTRATAAIKCAEAVLSNKARRTRSDAVVTGDQSTLQNQSTGKRSRVSQPSRRTTRTQSKHIYVFIIKTFHKKPTKHDWDKELHVVGQRKAFEKGQELCGRGTLYSLDVESWRLGSMTASMFEDAIAAGRKHFFLAAEGELDDVSFADVLVKAIECYKKHGSV